MNQTKKLAIISEEEILSYKFEVKKLHEDKILYDLKRFGHKFIKWEWKYEPLPDFHLELIVTYEEKRK